jgi:glycosyltransferase involved in cell wall biosynthesis
VGTDPRRNGGSDGTTYRVNIWQLCTPRELYSPETGGAVATVVAELSTELTGLGQEVTVAARIDGSALHEAGTSFASLGRIPWPASPYASLRWKVESGLNRAFGWSWPAYASYLVALWWRLRRSSGIPDVIVAHNDAFVVRYLRRWAPRATVVLWLHNEPLNLPRRRRATDRADLVVTVSGFLAGRAAALLGIDRTEIVTIHNGVNTVAFHPRPGFDEPSKPLRALCLGRLGRNKGADIALAAVRQLAGKGVQIQLDVVGSAWFSATPGLPKDPWADEFISELSAAGAVHTPHVPRDQVTALLRAHDIVCVLSRWDDPFPLVVLEAMASGCAVVASSRGGIPEAAGDAAVLVPSDDPDSVATILGEWASQPAALAEAKRASVARAAVATWEKSARQFVDALRTTRPQDAG